MNRKTTLILVGLLGALVLYLIFVQRPQEDAAKNATPTPGRGGLVWSLTSDQVVGLRVSNQAGQAAALTRDATGTWSITEPQAAAADQPKVINAVTGLLGLSYTSALSQATDLAAYGVVSPTFTLDVTLADGTHRKAMIGDKAPVGSAYYVTRDGETTVLVVDSYNLEALTAWILLPPYYVPTPTAEPTSGFTLPSLTPVP